MRISAIGWKGRSAERSRGGIHSESRDKLHLLACDEALNLSSDLYWAGCCLKLAAKLVYINHPNKKIIKKLINVTVSSSLDLKAKKQQQQNRFQNGGSLPAPRSRLNHVALVP